MIMRSTATIAAMLLLFSLLLNVFFSQPITFLSWIDLLFICSIITTLLGAILYIIQVGFFNSFIENFRYFFKKINPTEQILNEIEHKDSDHSVRSFKIPFSYPLLVAGLSMVLISTILSLILM